MFARMQSPVYRSSIRLEVSARFDNGQQLALERMLPQLAQRVRTTDVGREVDARLKADLGAEGIVSRLRVEPVAQNGQIIIQADDVDGPRAEAIVLETARVFEEQHAARNQGIPSQDRAIVSVLDRPAPASLVWPRTSLIAAVAAAAGLVIGCVLAVVLDYVDDTLKSADEVTTLLGVVVLASVPRGAVAGSGVVVDAVAGRAGPSAVGSA
jgi:capsular polysaccharide biosynthesis protein